MRAGIVVFPGSNCDWDAYHVMKDVDLSIVLSRFNRADAEKIFSRQIKVISNGITDPCPRFARDIQPRRKARFAARAKLLAGQMRQRDEAERLHDRVVLRHRREHHRRRAF